MLAPSMNEIDLVCKFVSCREYMLTLLACSVLLVRNLLFAVSFVAMEMNCGSDMARDHVRMLSPHQRDWRCDCTTLVERLPGISSKALLMDICEVHTHIIVATTIASCLHQDIENIHVVVSLCHVGFSVVSHTLLYS